MTGSMVEVGGEVVGKVLWENNTHGAFAFLPRMTLWFLVSFILLCKQGIGDPVLPVFVFSEMDPFWR